MTDIEITDDPASSRFVYREDGQEAQLVYRAEGDRLVLAHTEVPEALGGRGIGGRLVEAAVKRAAERGETVAPWCPYARRWLERHDDAAATVSVDWSPPPTRD